MSIGTLFEYFVALLTYKFVSRFVDRDMFMRYRGGGIGHTSTRGTHQSLLDDREDVQDVGEWDSMRDADIPNEEEEDYEDLLEDETESESNSHLENDPNEGGAANYLSGDKAAGDNDNNNDDFHFA